MISIQEYLMQALKVHTAQLNEHCKQSPLINEYLVSKKKTLPDSPTGTGYTSDISRISFVLSIDNEQDKKNFKEAFKNWEQTMLDGINRIYYYEASGADYNVYTIEIGDSNSKYSSYCFYFKKDGTFDALMTKSQATNGKFTDMHLSDKQDIKLLNDDDCKPADLVDILYKHIYNEQ